MIGRPWLLLFGAGLALFLSASASPSMAGCGSWGCQPACGGWYAPNVIWYPAVPCARPRYSVQPVYRVEQGPTYTVVVVPYEPVRIHYDFLPPRFPVECGCDWW